MIDWRAFTQQLGYTSEAAMWKDLYEEKGLSIAQITRKLGVSRNVIRGELRRAGCVMRKRGGPNRKRLVVTDELVDEIRRDGLRVVGKRLGISYMALYKRLRAVRGMKMSDLRKVGSPTENP